MGPQPKSIIVDFVERYRAGDTIAQIAEGAGVSYTTIHRRLRAAGECLRARGVPAVDLAERFMALVSPEPNSGCWLWAGCVGPENGYGYFNDGQAALAHRVSYELRIGPIPDDLHVDHLCRVRCCVNPAHLEAVTQAENNRRAVAIRS